MLYALNEMGYHAGTPMRTLARAARDFWSAPYNPASESAFASESASESVSKSGTRCTSGAPPLRPASPGPGLSQ